ncbi:hypothetical protein Pmar_PMAR021191 [Perkinsus marinus ATCC 50983]|uniref:HAT C-terminal dimerisation domain-containing protein n=2 Tax=Perkinsus marinus (strain ATCC 50983 / TXsc) TaxID=423536 RepID=C5KM76_PERM5|nr:hypothetical protein Pmar_PMAR021191 [Perkinsus marinus ATCC 50983]EER14437.1 hypothetical protein Pmar_PMAR021191 [Perkinsus marinus ATCC 50983]|eukprot:XP_002782642.1 hypothetical protein Pmar_PMAR021191 [Perkinsus marinus ATCC 50983]
MLHPATKVRGVEKLKMVTEYRRRIKGEESILRREDLIEALKGWSLITENSNENNIHTNHSTSENDAAEANMLEQVVEIADDSLLQGLIDVKDLPRWSERGRDRTADEKALLIDKEVKQWAKLGGHCEDYETFWNTAKLDYPYLARTATVARGVVISTACVESLFSEIRDIIGDKRTRMRMEVVEALLKTRHTYRLWDNDK